MIHRLEQDINSDQGPAFMTLKSDVTDVPQHLTVSLSEFPGTGPFKALYHQFRIIKVTFLFTPVSGQAIWAPGSNNIATVTPVTDQYTPTLYTSLNRTATGFATTVPLMMFTNNAKWVKAGNYHKRTFIPATLSQMYQSMTETAYQPEYRTWLSTEDTSTPHYGLDALLSATNAPKTAYKYKVTTIITAQYKNRKANTDLS